VDYVVFIALAPFAAAATLAVGVLAWRRRQAAGGRELAALAALSTGWVVLNALEVLHPTPGGTLFFAEAVYAVTPFIPAAWLAFALAFADRSGRAWTWVIRGIAAVGVATGALALTNDTHGLIWHEVAFAPHGPFLGLDVRYGPWFWVHAGLAWTSMLAGAVVILRVYLDAGRHVRRLSAWVAVGALLPVAINVLHVARVLPVAKDFSPIAVAVGAACFGLGLLRYRLLDLRPVARGVLLDRLGAGVLVLDAQHRVVDVNPAMERLLGVPGGALGQPIGAFLSPAQVEAFRPFGFENDAHGEVTLGEGDAQRHYDLQISPLTDRHGEIHGRLVVLHDVTARRAAEAALEARNADLDAFAHTVAHDLKNPIQNVMGFSEILAEEGADLPPEVLRECAETVHRTARKMQAIVHELLLLAGVQQETVTPVPLAMGGIVAEALDRLHPMIARAGAVVTVAPRWPTALGYAPWVEEVWANYVSNAVKYGAVAGHPARIALGADADASGDGGGGAVRFWVTDEGPGPPEGADLFLPFTRVGQVRAEGHGLGLSIVRRIVERLGGTCGVEPRPTGGSLFWFALPPAPLEPAAVAPLRASRHVGM